MAQPPDPQYRQRLTADLTARAISLWGEERTKFLEEHLQENVDHLMALYNNLPPLEEVPTMTWQNHP